MKRVIIIAILLSAIYYFFKVGDFFATSTQKMVKRVKQMDISSFELEWTIPQKGEEVYISIYEGSDLAIIEAIKQAMDSVVPHSKRSFTYIWVKALGMLKLKADDGSEEKIDIAHCCFFVGGDRVESAAFYSPELSGIVKDIIDNSPHKNRLVMTEDLYNILAEGGNLKYLIQPEARKEFEERLKEKLIERRESN